MSWCSSSFLRWLNPDFVSISLSAINVNAQRYKYAISGSFGYIQDGLSGMVGFDYRLNDKSYIELNMQYNSSTYTNKLKYLWMLKRKKLK